MIQVDDGGNLICPVCGVHIVLRVGQSFEAGPIFCRDCHTVFHLEPEAAALANERTRAFEERHQDRPMPPSFKDA